MIGHEFRLGRWGCRDVPWHVWKMREMGKMRKLGKLGEQITNDE